MPFGVEWAPRGEDDYHRLPELLASRLLDQIERLAQDPVRLSTPPRRSGEVYQRYAYEDVTDDGNDVRVEILFQYTQDEMSIEILGVGLREL